MYVEFGSFIVNICIMSHGTVDRTVKNVGSLIYFISDIRY